MDVLAGSSTIEIGFAIALFGAVIAGIRRNDSRFTSMEKQSDARFNKLESQVKDALKGQFTRQEHQIWALQLQVKNPTLNVPNHGADTDA